MMCLLSTWNIWECQKLYNHAIQEHMKSGSVTNDTSTEHMKNKVNYIISNWYNWYVHWTYEIYQIYVF